MHNFQKPQEISENVSLIKRNTSGVFCNVIRNYSVYENFLLLTFNKITFAKRE